MIAELTTTPLGNSPHLAEAIARVIRVIHASGLHYQVTALGTLVEGPADDVWKLLRACHDTARQHSERVLTGIRIDDAADAELSRLASGINRVEAEIGSELPRSP